jgi:hypothetical protein
MIAKLPVLGFALVTAVSGTALAHEGCGTPAHASWGNHTHAQPAYNAEQRGPARGGPAYNAPAYGNRNRGYTAELRRSDIDRDGRVSIGEALDYGRVDFQRTDRDNNRVLTGYEYRQRGEFASEDLNRDGRVTYREHQRGVRSEFARLDRNGDGYLMAYEIDGRGGPQRGWNRSAGWRR